MISLCHPFDEPFFPLQEEAWRVRQEPCASLTPTTWTTASYRGRGQGAGLHFDHEQEAFHWSLSYTRWVGMMCVLEKLT